MLVGLAAAWYLADDEPPYEHWSFLWTRWDAAILLNIARFGYSEAADPHATAFFPGFPLLLKPLAEVGTTWLVYGALLLNTLASIVAVRYLILLGDETGEGVGRRAGLYLLVFPTAVFLIAPYTEALFLAGAVPAFYYARRMSWLPAGAAAGVAMAARFAGVFLILGLIVEWVRRRKDPLRAALGLLIALAPLLAYCLYLWASRGDPFYFFVDQREGWGRELTNPVSAFRRTWDTWTVGDHPMNWRFAWRMEIVAAIVGIALVVWAARKREWGYATFMGSLLATLLVSTWYFSIPRMLLTMFPITLLLAGWTRARTGRHEAVLVGSAATCALGVIVFTQGAWFY
jgi:Gpi18-like mannosyltransferase